MRISITLPFNLCSVLWEADLCRLHRRPRTSRSKSLHCSAPFPGLLFNSFPIVVLLWPPHFLSLSPLFQDCSLSLLSLVVRVLSVISPWHWHYASWLPAPLEIQPAPSPNGSVPLPLAMILAGTLGIPVQNPQGKNWSNLRKPVCQDTKSSWVPQGVPQGWSSFPPTGIYLTGFGLPVIIPHLIYKAVQIQSFLFLCHLPSLSTHSKLGPRAGFCGSIGKMKPIPAPPSLAVSLPSFLCLRILACLPSQMRMNEVS